MPSERTIVDSILVDLRSKFDGALVVKHNDAGNKGIPDIQRARAGRTSWFEIKYLRRGATLKGINKAQQLSVCHQFATVNDGRCWVIVFEEPTKAYKGRRTVVWQPKVLFRHLWPRVAGPVTSKRVSLIEGGLQKWPYNDKTVSELLGDFGAFYLDEWTYDVASLLLKASGAA